MSGCLIGMLSFVRNWIFLSLLSICNCGRRDQFITSRNLAPNKVEKRSWDESVHGASGGTAENKLSRQRRSLPNAEDSKTALDQHNYYRSVIGDETSAEEPIPSNMQYMSWDPALSITSLIYARKCIFEHSTVAERSTKDFPGWNGENLWAGRGRFAGEYFNPEVGIESWYMEYVDYDFYKMYCEPGKQCGHYTQVVWATTYKLGCAWVNCSKFDTTEGEIWSDAAYMVCHYAPGGNKNDEFLYKVGERCADCHPNDTCPDGRLCRNAERDKVLPGPSDAGYIVGLAFSMLLLIGLLAGGIYYIFLHVDDFCVAWAFIKKKTKIGNSGAIQQHPDSADIHRNGHSLPRQPR